MPNCLALDIGTRRTGVALSYDAINVPLALEVLISHSKKELLQKILTLVKTYSIQILIIGDPLLLDGSSGKQSALVHGLVQELRTALPSYCTVQLIDERYTSLRTITNKDTTAALTLLEMYLQQNI